MAGEMILGRGISYSLDTRKTRRNNNVLVAGAPGVGKTRGVVIPNILAAEGSYIITDPKGNLHRQYAPYLVRKGYEVKKLDFTNPQVSEHYNFFRYIRNPQDVVRVAHLLTRAEDGRYSIDPFWDNAAQILLASVISYLSEFCPPEEQCFSGILKLLPAGRMDGVDGEELPLDILMDEAAAVHPESFAARYYRRIRVSAENTLRSILVSLFALLCVYDTPEVEEMLSGDGIDIPAIGQRKTALFVVVSDTDRSMDRLVNIFFTQAMQELCRYADTCCEDNRLPVPVRFIMDDFATNCTILDFPRMISSIRSREISVMLMIQSEGQLAERYGADGRTVIAGCDTYVYMGGNDVETARAVSERSDQPLQWILDMPVGKEWIFRRGEKPVFADCFDLSGQERDGNIHPAERALPVSAEEKTEKQYRKGGS